MPALVLVWHERVADVSRQSQPYIGKTMTVGCRQYVAGAGFLPMITQCVNVMIDG